MVRKITILLCLFQITLLSQADEKYKFTYEIEKDLYEGNIDISRASYLYNNIAEYNQAVSMYDIPISWDVDSISLNQIIIKEAVCDIINSAKDKKIVIISESHLKPQHRIFASQIIDSLYNYGFRHLGLEGLAPTDTINAGMPRDSFLNVRKFPLLNAKNGFFVLETTYSKLIRNALNRGYNLFAYERYSKEGTLDRDQIQAKNILRYTKANNVDKFIIVVGWHHAIESNLEKSPNYYWLGKLLKDMYNTDPLTIYQDNYTEKVYENSHPILQHFNDSINIYSIYSNHSNNKNVDIEILHPPTRFINGRPNWLATKSSKYYRPELGDVEYPVMCMAFLKSEYTSRGVPLDCIELSEQYDKKYFILEPGEYTIECISKKDSVTHYNVIIE